MIAPKKSGRPLSLRKIGIGLLVQIVGGVGLWLVLSASSLRAVPGVFGYLSVIAVLAVVITILPLVKDEPGTLVAWPGVMVLLGSMTFWSLFGVVGPRWVAAFVVATVVLYALALFLLVKAAIAIGGQDPVSLMHPLLLKSMVGTSRTNDEPVEVSIALDEARFPAWVDLARSSAERGIADMVRVSADHVTMRFGRVARLPRYLSLALLPFGATVIQADASGVVRVRVDRHMYRILDRPGPYERFCRNLVEALSQMAGPRNQRSI